MEEFLGGRVVLHGGDSRDVLRTLADNSIDSVVTDPPYALVSMVRRFGGETAAPPKGPLYARVAAGFMGKTWDTGETAFTIEFWREVLRVLKPGGYLVAASGTRTYHRLAVAIEDAGFEIRDQVQWLYGSGFPKSHAPLHGIRSLPRTLNRQEWRYFHRVARVMSGTALKPACEPWVMARKPLIGTIAQNVHAWGTGALNIDGCRIDGGKDVPSSPRRAPQGAAFGNLGCASGDTSGFDPTIGRWPANVIHDGSAEVAGMFPDSLGQKADVRDHARTRQSPNGIYNGMRPAQDRAARLDSGSAARFFYSAKADAMDRLGAKHPTVKPVDLMQYIERLVTPPGGVVLDPFAGTGSTAEAAWREGFRCVLIEREPDYLADIRRRLRWVDASPVARRAAAKVNRAPAALPLFGPDA